MVYEDLADALGNARMPNHMIDLAADIERAASTRGEPKLLLVDHRRTIAISDWILAPGRLLKRSPVSFR